MRKIQILLAIPTAKYIEADTFKSIYDLDVPDNVDLHYQHFYGYNIDQVRNLIAHWATHYDYLFSVDSDIVLPKDCLVKMLNHNVDMVSGVYIQRKEHDEILEIYRKNNFGGVSNVPFIHLQPQGLHEIDGCGFGCVLVKSEVIRKIGYPQFKYHSALDHKDTISEDVDFCEKARNVGARIFVDSTIVCNHIGSRVFVPSDIMSDRQQKEYLRYLSTWSFREEDVQYLQQMKNEGVEPRVIYDIGACTGNWTREARRIWPNTEFVLFDAMDQVEFLLKETGFNYHIGVLSDVSHKKVEFFENVWQPGGNSYYREVGHPDSMRIFSDGHKVVKTTRSLDDVVRYNNFPLPDMIKVDVQGCELDVLKGASYALSQCSHLLVEVQHTPYNAGAPLKDEVFAYLSQLGFVQKHAMTPTPFDGDYHFIKI